MGGAIDRERKKYESIGRRIHHVTMSSGLKLGIFKVNFWKPIFHEWDDRLAWSKKGCESIGCQTHSVMYNYVFNHELELGFSNSHL